MNPSQCCVLQLNDGNIVATCYDWCNVGEGLVWAELNLTWYNNQ